MIEAQRWVACEQRLCEPLSAKISSCCLARKLTIEFVSALSIASNAAGSDLPAGLPLFDAVPVGDMLSSVLSDFV